MRAANNLLCEFISTHTTVEVVFTDTVSSPLTTWDGIEVLEGRLLVNPLLAHPGDLAHEAGHLVTMPIRYRRLLNGFFDGSFIHALTITAAQEILQNQYGDDQAATCWGFLALQFLGLEPAWVFENGYPDKEGKDEAVAVMASKGKGSYGYSLAKTGLLSKQGELLKWDVEQLDSTHSHW